MILKNVIACKPLCIIHWLGVRYSEGQSFDSVACDDEGSKVKSLEEYPFIKTEAQLA